MHVECTAEGLLTCPDRTSDGVENMNAEVTSTGTRSVGRCGLPSAVSFRPSRSAGLGLVLAFLVGCFSGGSTPNVRSSTPKARVTAVQLFEEYEANEVRADDAYAGEVIEISGTVKSINSSGRGATVLLDVGGAVSSITCRFEEGDRADVTRIDEDMPVVLKGIVSGMTLWSVIVDSCVLVRIS